jgi:predicted Zn finger-like uncharacterized protein
MILTCPNCATRYFVEDERLGPAGRAVRCAGCGVQWRARAEAPLELGESPEIGAVAQEPPAPPASEASPAAELRDLPAEELPKVFRGRAQTKEKVREAATSGVIWAGLVAGFAVLIGAAVVLRQDIATIWPRAAGAYAMAGLPVNLVGLSLEDQHAQPALKDGHAVLTVSGALRNIRDRPTPAAPLRISILNAAGQVLAVKIADPGGALIPPGETRHFVVDVVDPPEGANDVDIGFLLNAPPRRSAAPRASASLSPPPATLPPGPVQNAAPLPTNSPYALPNPPADASGAHG